MTVRAGRVAVTVWPATGELAVGAERLPGVDGAAALCVIVNVVPPMVSVAVRAAPVFAATVNVTVPLPLPDEGAEIVTKVALTVALHVHAVPAVTVIGTDPVPPAAPNDEVVIAPTVTVHDGVVVVPLLLFEEQATAPSNRAAAAKRRRFENDMRASRE